MTDKKSKKKRGKSARAQGASGSPMDVVLLEQIVKLMAANDLNTVEVRDGDKRVVLKRGQPMPQMVHVSQALGASAPMMSAAAPMPAGAAPAAPAGAGAGSAQENTASEEAGLVAIKSPMVGTFYASPAKGAKPFVTVGSVVDEDTDVCIVEAMKVFNNIKAECRGTIVKVLVEDGQPVEFAQPLFLVKPM